MQWPEIALVVLIVAHIIVCVLIFLGIQFRILKVRKLMFWVALFMPVWGPALVLALHIQIALKQSNKTEVGVEKFQVASELYKGIKQDTSRTPGFTVSMEEALIVNTPKERRSLIMDILNDNPQAYVEFLKMAGNNEDTEVVHYAVTAMVQISKENDQILWELEQKYAQAPNDLDTIMTYCGFLWHCLDQGLMQGQVERMNRNLFDTLIHKKIKLDSPHIADYIRCIKNCMALGNYTEANAMLESAREFWPRSEDLLLLKIQYLADLQRADEIQALLDELEANSAYLSDKAKEAIAFWRE